MHRLLAIMTILLFFGAVAWLACSAAGGRPHYELRDLAGRLDTVELTSREAKLVERVINTEVSPCGEEITLAESLLVPERCPLAPLAGRFVVGMAMEDHNAEEISAAYLNRYAAIRGLGIPLDGSPRKGPEAAAVTIVAFTDFACPYCARAAKQVELLVRSYPEHVALAFKHFPLASHPAAELMSRAAFAAMQQGKFWEMHDVLFSAQGSPVDRGRVDTMAVGLALDPERFSEDLASPAATAAIEADRRLGESLGVDGTPTLFVNGRKLESGARDLDERLDEEFLRQAVIEKK
ncbi:MAG TPA: thioredoxin domain-containing protein [Polyangia bacterium]|nr:thioredoxin domain-containing protein [Polyangia bacterium]